MIVWYDLDLCPPPVDERVLVVCRTVKGVYTVNIGYFDGNGCFHGMGSNAKVTHWMKLPKFPEEMMR